MRLECQLPINSWSQFPIYGWRVSSKLSGTSLSWIRRNRKSLCELYRAGFLRKRFSLVASELWILVDIAVDKFGLVLSLLSEIDDVQAWLTSVSAIRSFLSSLIILPGLWFDIFLRFLITFKEISNWLHLAFLLASPVD